MTHKNQKSSPPVPPGVSDPSEDEAADAPALANALQQLLRDGAQAQRLGQAARQQALASYGREQMWHRYRALLTAPQAPAV